MTLDLSAASLDTVTRLNDDRSAVVAMAATQGMQAILSDTTPFVEVIGASGGSVRFGTAGDGPGEFRFPSGIAAFGDSLAVWDPSSARFSVFDRTGHLLRTQSAPAAMGKIAVRMLRDGYGNPGRIAPSSGGLVIASYTGVVQQPADLWTIALVRIRPDGALDTLSTGYSPTARLREMSQDAKELVAVPLWSSCGAHGLATWDPVGGMLRRFTASGAAGRSDSIGGPATALTDDLIRINLRYQLDGLLQGKRPEPAVYAQMIESMLEQSQARNRRFPSTTPAFVSMQCDDAGRVWLQQFSLADAGSGMGQTWTIVDPAGNVSGVRLPPNLRVLHVANGAVWGVRSGEDGQLFLLTLVLPTP